MAPVAFLSKRPRGLLQETCTLVGMSREPEPSSPASFISGVKVCEDVTRNGFSCLSVVGLLCVVTLWPFAPAYLLRRATQDT